MATPQAAEDLWPKILEAVGKRRRFAWILLSENAEVIRLHDQVIQLKFKNESSREIYRSSGVGDVLASTILEDLNLPWRVEVVEPEANSDSQGIQQKNSETRRPDEQQPGAWPSSIEPKKPAPRPGEWPKMLKPNAGEPSSDLGELQEQWPRILAAVKEKRRFAWIILDQNAKVTSFDGETLQLTFSNNSAKENYLSAGIDEVLKQVLRDSFKSSWKIDAVADR